MSVFTLFADRPARDADDQLWFASPKDRSQPKPIRRQLDQIAATLVAPLALGANPAASLTIAIHGAPGSGKSSALNVLWDLASAKARALAQGADGDAVAARLVKCSYVAPNWESPDMSARTSLVAAMLVSLAGDETAAVKKLLGPAQALSDDLGASEPRDAQGRKMWASKMIGRIAVEVAKLRNVEDLLRESLPDASGRPRVLAMMIDDLDRCSPAFVYALLSELLERSDLDNFFFLLSASPGTLLRAVTEGAGAPNKIVATDAHSSAALASRGQVAVHDELAKLVQHIVDVPLVDADGMRALLSRLFDDKLAVAAADPIATAILDSAPLFGLALPEATPRAVKRCLNFLVARLGDRALDASSPSEIRAQVKRLLLEYAWPDFYRESFEPMTSDGPGRNLAPIVMLEETASRAALVDGTDRRVSHELEYVCDAFPALHWDQLPVPLLRFLSAPPRLAITSSQAARPPRVTSPTERPNVAPPNAPPPQGPPQNAPLPPPPPPGFAPPAIGSFVSPPRAPSSDAAAPDANEGVGPDDPPAAAQGDTPDASAGDSPDDPPGTDNTRSLDDVLPGDDAALTDARPPFFALESLSSPPGKIPPPPPVPGFGAPPGLGGPHAPPDSVGPHASPSGGLGGPVIPGVRGPTPTWAVPSSRLELGGSSPLASPAAPPPNASPAAPPANVSAPREPLDRVLDEALREVQGLADPIARADRSAHAIFELRDLGKDAEPAAICLCRALWPVLLAAPRDGQMLCAVMDTYVEMLVDRGMRRTACAVLHEAYTVIGDQAHVRERFSLFLTGAGALSAARRVMSHLPIEVVDLLADDPSAVPLIEAASPRVQPLVRATTGASG